MVLTGVMFVSVWICDSAAYIFGKKFGKKKIAPKISPKKTWVGSLSGLFFSVLFVFGFYYNHWFDYDFAQKMIDFLAEIAKADGVVLDNEKFSLDDLANLWEVESRL